MLRIGAIGSGNTGNQIITLAKEMMGIPVIAVNSSEKDLSTIPDEIEKCLLTDDSGISQGAGKNRTLAKKYLKASITKFLQMQSTTTFITGLDVVFVIGSTGGGTGSGTVPVMVKILSSMYPDVLFIAVGIGPVSSEALSAQVNTLQYLDEIYNHIPNVRYMLYDNDNFADRPSYQMMDYVNKEVVEDMKVIQGLYNKATKYDSIDTEDGLRLVSFPGRIVVARVDEIREKDRNLEDLIINAIKTNAHMEIQRDHKVMATGLIMNLSDQLIEDFNNHIPRVHDLIGEPVHEFLHVYINHDKKEPNSVYLIVSGLSPVNDKIEKINERIKVIEEAQAVRDEESAMNKESLSALSEMISKNDGRVQTDEDEVDLDNVFADFGL